MLPTIDISVLGVLIALGHFFVVLWNIVVKVWNFAREHLIAAVMGSKIWATAFFLTIGGLSFTLFGSLVSAAVTHITSLAVANLSVSPLVKSSFGLVCSVVPLDFLFDTLVFSGTAAASYYAVCTLHFGYRRFVGLFRTICASWKT